MPPFRKQGDEPLFPQTLWNRPVARRAGGRLLIAGGHRDNFSLPTNLYQLTEAAGIGQTTVVLPDALRPLLAGAPDVVFVPSSPSGSLGRAGLGEVTDLAGENDTLLLAGLSNNSETAILAESLIRTEVRSFILADDAPETLQHQLVEVASNERGLVILTLPRLLKLAGALKLPLRITRSDLAGKLSIVQAIASVSRCSYLIAGPELIVASGGELTVTDLPAGHATALTVTALAAAFWTQNPDDHLGGLTTAAYVARQALNIASEAASTDQLAKAIRQVLAGF